MGITLDQIKRVAFVSTRLAGTDGVSLETAKWAAVLERMGLVCCYIAGECDRPKDVSRVIDEAHFNHPTIRSINERAFGREVRARDLTMDILKATMRLVNHLELAIDELEVDALIVENAFTIPMNIPLGLALVNVVAEGAIPCLAHHHDFEWERDRFALSSIEGLMRSAFPPPLRGIGHIVINTQAREQLALRTGLSSRVVPNVMDFENPPPPPDDYSAGFKQAIGLAPDDIMILQPTRVVQRKGIETAIELVRRLDDPKVKLVITHAAGDEGQAYAERIDWFAELMGVDVIIAEDWISETRSVDDQGRKQFTLGDAYSQAALVTYASTLEGFGNAFIEAVYYKRPVFANRYSIYYTDIEPYGFDVVLMDQFLSKGCVADVKRLLADEARIQAMVDHNYDVGETFFSYKIVEHELKSIIGIPRKLFRQSGREYA